MLKQCPNCKAQSIQHVIRGGERKSICSSCDWLGPGCYGHLYDATDPKCVGGNDSTYWNPTNRRPACKAKDTCSLASQQQIIPPNQLTQTPPNVTLPMMDGTKRTVGVQPYSVQVKPAQPQHVPQVPQIPQIPVMQQQQIPQVPNLPVPQVPQPPTQQPHPQQVQGYYLMPGQQQPVMMVPPQQAQQPAYIPQNAVDPGAPVMAVIAVQEPETAPYMHRFAGSVGRAMLKYGFLTAANFMDYVPWNKPQ